MTGDFRENVATIMTSSSAPAAASPTVLLIDDDLRLAAMLGDFLAQNGLALRHAALGGDGLAALQQPGRPLPDVLILDLMLPDANGLDLCRQIRSLAAPAAQLPLLMLTAKGDPMDRVLGLELGADDYLPKPFEPRELLARVRALLRRTRLAAPAPDPAATPTRPTELVFGGLHIDRDTRSVTLHASDGQVTVCDLTSYQFDLLVVLAERAGRVLTREQILDAARGRELEAFDRSIDVHMGRIRAAIEADVKNPRRILTVRGVGYVFARQQD
jgi:two-component system, OmpR family, phosphate regulon response regulator OmpR